MAHLGSYLFHELTTPLGLRLDHVPASRVRQTAARPASAASAPTPSGSRAACCCAWRPGNAAGGLWRNGQAAATLTAQAELEAAHARVLADPDLRPEALAGRLARPGQPAPRKAAGDALTRLLADHRGAIAAVRSPRTTRRLGQAGGRARPGMARQRRFQPIGGSTIQQQEPGEPHA